MLICCCSAAVNLSVDDEVRNNTKIYPDEEYLKKCEIFIDLGEKTDAYDKLWLTVTTSN